MNPETNADPNAKQVVPFFAVADIEAPLRFWVDGLGFTVTHQWRPEGRRRSCRLQNGGAARMLQAALAIYHADPKRGLTPRRPFLDNAL